MLLRPNQQEVETGIYRAWSAGKRNVMPVVPTGGGKTVIFSNIHQAFDGNSIAVAHRQELLSQISMALARNEVRHRIVAPDSVRRNIEAMHLREFKRRWVDQTARAGVAGVDTLVRIDPTTDPWLQRMGLITQDEGHHVLRDNKWGKAAAMFPNAYGLLPTATPRRADGKGLGRHADGVVDEMIVGPDMRSLINMGFLTDYKLFAPRSNLDLSDVPVSAGGDYSPPKLAAAVHKSSITGDVVRSYLEIAPGKLGVTFAVDIEAATEIAAAFRAAGVPAEVVSSKTPDLMRAHILDRFKRREILQLVNVDLFGEGFDLPAIEVVSMARPTQSFSLYAQQFGRALRLMISVMLQSAWGEYSDLQRLNLIALSDKPHAVIIDHVDNWLRHGLPDAGRVWTLDARERGNRGTTPDDVIPLRRCLNVNVGGTGVPCDQPYERVLVCCPHCGFKPEPSSRGGPEFVDGDLCEIDPEVLRKMRGEADAVMLAPRIPFGAAPEVEGSIKKRHFMKQKEQARLRTAISGWAARQDMLGHPMQEQYRRFYHTFNIDVLSAQALNAQDAGALSECILQKLAVDGVVINGLDYTN